MGVAAYNRGSRLISRQLDATERPHLAKLYDDLTALSEARGWRDCFAKTVIRRDPIRGDWCLMNRRDRGWGERCYGYPSLWTLFAEWRLVVVGDGRDAAGWYIEVAPLARIGER